MIHSTNDQMNTLKDYELFLMGQPILAGTQPGHGPYVVVEGVVAIFSGDRWLESICPGAILHEQRLITAAGPDFVAMAQTNSILVAVDEAMLPALEQHQPDFVVQIMRVMVERLTRRVALRMRLVSTALPQPELRKAFRNKETATNFTAAFATAPMSC